MISLWFLLACLPPVIWAASNVIDSALVSSKFKVGILPITALQALIGIVFIIGMPFVFDMQWHEFLQPKFYFYIGLILLFRISDIFIYYHVLKKDHPENVIALYNLYPIFVAIIGYILLQETISPPQIIAGLMLICGSIAFGWKENEKINRTLMFFMLLGCLSYAGFTLCVRISTQNFHPDSIMFGLFCIELLFFSLFYILPSTAKTCRGLLVLNKASLFIFVSSMMGKVGRYINAIALSLAPNAAIVGAIGGTQPLFVWIIGLVISILILKKPVKTSKHDIIVKFISIALMLVGLYFLRK